MPLETLSSTSRVTRFQIDAIECAYTTYSSDSRGLGDIGIIGPVSPDAAETGSVMWQLATRYCSERAQIWNHAEWIITQARRVAILQAPAVMPWTVHIGRTHAMGTLYANHETLKTGRFDLC